MLQCLNVGKKKTKKEIGAIGFTNETSVQNRYPG